MADSFIQLPPDSTGKRLDAESVTVGGLLVHRQRIVHRASDWQFSAGGGNQAVNYTWPAQAGVQHFVTFFTVTWASGPTAPQEFTISEGTSGIQRYVGYVGSGGLVANLSHPIGMAVGEGIKVTLGAGGIGNNSRIFVSGYSVS